MFDGIAKPMPMLPPLPEKMALFTPTSCALQIHERAAGIARIDRRIGLNEVLIRLGIVVGAAERADDAGGHRVTERKRIADREHEVADFGLTRVRERHFDEIFRVDLQHRHIGGFVAADDLRLELPIVEQRDGDLVGVFDDVCVGDDVAVLRVDDDAGSGALKLTLPRARCPGASKKRRKKGSSSSGLRR